MFTGAETMLAQADLTAAPPDGFTPRQMIRLPNPKSRVKQSQRPG